MATPKQKTGRKRVRKGPNKGQVGKKQGTKATKKKGTTKGQRGGNPNKSGVMPWMS